MLEKIVVKEHDLEIPDKPHCEANKRSACLVLGTMTNESRQLEAKHFKNIEAFCSAANKLSKERNERNNPDSMYAGRQQFDPPSLRSIKGKRIDILWPMEGRSNKALWFQGKVTEVRPRSREVTVLWDANPDIPDFELPVECPVTLDEEKYRRYVHYGWRMDLDVELFDNFYEEDDKDVVCNDDERSIGEKDGAEIEVEESMGNGIDNDSEEPDVDERIIMELDWDNDQIETYAFDIDKVDGEVWESGDM